MAVRQVNESVQVTPLFIAELDCLVNEMLATQGIIDRMGHSLKYLGFWDDSHCAPAPLTKPCHVTRIRRSYLGAS